MLYLIVITSLLKRKYIFILIFHLGLFFFINKLPWMLFFSLRQLSLTYPLTRSLEAEWSMFPEKYVLSSMHVHVRIYVVHEVWLLKSVSANLPFLSFFYYFIFIIMFSHRTKLQSFQTPCLSHRPRKLSENSHSHIRIRLPQ